MKAHDGFDALNYCQHFAPFHYTYIRGFRELTTFLLLEPHFDTPETVVEYLKGARALALCHIPPDWQRVRIKNAHWTICRPEQVGRIWAGEAARLDRVCQTVLALDIAFKLAQEAKLKSINVFDFVELIPAVYALQNLSPPAKAWLKGGGSASDHKRWEELVAALSPVDGEPINQRAAFARKFLSDVACGYPLTYENAEVIAAHFKGGWGTPKIVPLRNRMEGRPAPKGDNRPKLRCCANEGYFVRLGKMKLDKLQQLRPKDKAVQAAG